MTIAAAAALAPALAAHLLIQFAAALSLIVPKFAFVQRLF